MGRGADLVVGEAATLQGEPSLGRRMVRRYATQLLPRRLRVSGIRDMTSGFAAFRLMTLRNALRHPTATLLQSEGRTAAAELIARAARHARRVESVPIVERYDLRTRASRTDPWVAARQLYLRRDELFPYALDVRDPQEGEITHVLLPMLEERIELTLAGRIGTLGNLTTFGLGVSNVTHAQYHVTSPATVVEFLRCLDRITWRRP